MANFIDPTRKKVREMLDVTLLDMTINPEDFDSFLLNVKEIHPATVCIQPCRVTEAASFLCESGIGISSVVAFPAGGSVIATKAAEAAHAVKHGATEVDMVLNLSTVRSGDKNAIVEEISAVVEAAKSRTVKVIVEAPILSAKEKELVCEAITEGKAHFIKTCSGFASNWADPRDVKLFRELLPMCVSIKASGKIGSLERLTELYEAGARRFGVLVSQAQEILSECPDGGNNENSAI